MDVMDVMDVMDRMDVMDVMDRMGPMDLRRTACLVRSLISCATLAILPLLVVAEADGPQLYWPEADP